MVSAASEFLTASVDARCGCAHQFGVCAQQLPSAFVSMLRRRIAHKALGNPAFAAQQRGLAIWTGSEAPAKRHYDILVVGSGGGAKVATPAAKLGFKVGVLEHGFDAFGRHLNGLGGTCLNRGCIPSKMLIHAAEVAQEVKDAHRFSVQAQFQGVDLEELVTRVEKEVDGDSASIEKGYASDPLRDWCAASDCILSAWSPSLLRRLAQRTALAHSCRYKSTGRFIGERTMQIGTAEVSVCWCRVKFSLEFTRSRCAFRCLLTACSLPRAAFRAFQTSRVWRCVPPQSAHCLIRLRSG